MWSATCLRREVALLEEEEEDEAESEYEVLTGVEKEDEKEDEANEEGLDVDGLEDRERPLAGNIVL